MTIELAALPYAADALAPHISERTISFHYGKHHAGYVRTVNSAVAGTPDESRSLDDLVRSLPAGGLFNAAAQTWNHDFYWQSMSPGGGGDPEGDLATAIVASFGSSDAFRTQFAAGAVGNFGSGWGWLVHDPAVEGSLRIVQTDDAGTPLVGGLSPCWSSTFGSTPTTSTIRTPELPTSMPSSSTSCAGNSQRKTMPLRDEHRPSWSDRN